VSAAVLIVVSRMRTSDGAMTCVVRIPSLKDYHKFQKYIASFLLPACGEEQAPGNQPPAPAATTHGPARVPHDVSQGA
jgi:hypothetical protein